jgi:hypothetical protein
MTILDHFAEADCFAPRTVDEYFALQLAIRLGDVKNIRLYIGYVGRFSHEQLACLVQSALACSPDAPAPRFHSSLKQFEP